MKEQDEARRIVDKMIEHDPFSRWLGIEIIEVSLGNAVLQMQVREDMLNGFSIAHGGISYSLADSALAFASNAHGRQCVSVETSISHVQQVRKGDVLRTRVKEVSLSHKIGIYHITILNQFEVEVAHFKGSVYRSSKVWEV